MKLIPLTQGMVAVVDSEDFDELSKYQWYAVKAKSGAFYAARYNPANPKVRMYMHQQLMPAPKGKVTDHKDRNSLDNRKQNLRITTKGLNRSNAKLNANSTSGFKGVSWNKRLNKFQVRCGGNGRAHLGWFKTATEAAAVYDATAQARFGEFAVTNRSLGLIPVLSD